MRLLVDTDRNGTLDKATVFAAGFDQLADGIASGVLPVGQDVWFTNIPKLWRLRDADGDGVAEVRDAVHDGYGVHTSLIGHDLHGLVVGPDRRLYFSIGDRGFHVEHEGRTHAYPDEGAVLRCELDGSGLEVVHRGLRNPQELAFDLHGDLFTGDNNSDGGDRARLVQIVPGADSGWRIGFQWLDDRGAWNRERMWHPRHPGQPAITLPPIANFADGPSGLAFDPGVGLPERFRSRATTSGSGSSGCGRSWTAHGHRPGSRSCNSTSCGAGSRRGSPRSSPAGRVGAARARASRGHRALRARRPEGAAGRDGTRWVGLRHGGVVAVEENAQP